MTAEAALSRFRKQTSKAVITGGGQADIGSCHSSPAAVERFSMNYVYNPVPSRRLGQSLEVDPIPLKTCNYNCVYCQLGRTTPLANEHRDFFLGRGSWLRCSRLWSATSPRRLTT